MTVSLNKSRRSAPKTQTQVQVNQIPVPMERSTKPTHVVRMSPFRVAIWTNPTKDGKNFFSVTFERAFMKKDGTWGRSASANENNVLVLIAALREAQEWIERANKTIYKDTPPV